MTRTIILLTVIITLITPKAFALNHALSLDGDGDYVEIKDSLSLNTLDSQVTLEAWIKPTAFPNQWMPLIYKGDKRTSDAYENRSYTLWLNLSSGFIHFASAPNGQRQKALNSPMGWIALSRWSHVAGVIDAQGGVMKLYINGTEVASGPYGKGIHQSALPLRIGWTHEAEKKGLSPFAGQIDEVRIWNIARTPSEILATMTTALTGKEAGLVGYWNFEGDGKQGIDATGHGHDGKLVGDAAIVVAEKPTAVVSGVIRNEKGRALSAAKVLLRQADARIGHFGLAVECRRTIRVGASVGACGATSACARTVPVHFSRSPDT